MVSFSGALAAQKNRRYNSAAYTACRRCLLSFPSLSFPFLSQLRLTLYFNNNIRESAICIEPIPAMSSHTKFVARRRDAPACAREQL